jgi:hypothetical protein
MSQVKLKEYQKEIFEYEYTAKKIDTILISSKLSPDEKEHYQFSREACLKTKNKCTQEMNDYARQNKMSLLMASLSREEKDEIIKAMEDKNKGDSSAESIKFDDIRPKEAYEEKPAEIKPSFPVTPLSSGRYEIQEEEEEEEDHTVQLEEEKNEEELSARRVHIKNLEDEVNTEIETVSANTYSNEVNNFVNKLKDILASFYGD